VTMQSAAIHQRVHRVGFFIGQATVLAKGHLRIADILRRVVNGVRILRKRGRERLTARTAPE